MLDTVKLKSPPIDEETAAAVELRLVQRMGWENETGIELYSLASGSLEGSWSSSVGITVFRTEQKVFPSLRMGQKPVTEMVDCPPYLVVEGSVHKAMMGHNIFGGPERLHASLAWFVADIERRLDVQLPPWGEWEVHRIDVTEVYDLGSFEACSQFIHGLSLARFPRRKVLRYGDETVMFPGFTTALKFYHKGPEFAKNGHKVVLKTLGEKVAHELQFRANNYLRVECSIKKRKLITLGTGESLKALDTCLELLEGVHDRDTSRVLKEGQHDMETVRTTEEVRARLHEVYEERLANLLFGTWLQLAAVGEEGVRRTMSHRTYYRHRSQLADAGIAWNATDVYIREQSFIPAGFRPVRSDPRRVSGESLAVKKALLPYAVA